MFGISAALAVLAPYACTICGSSPCVKATILFAIFGRIIVAETVIRLIVEVLGHPPLVADFYSLVGLTIAVVS